MRTSFKLYALVLLICPLFHSSQALRKRETCRSVPGSAGFPSASTWSAFNETISGRLVEAVPSAKYCATLPGGCTEAQWTSALFRSTIPGAMNKVNFEQDLLCGGTDCGGHPGASMRIQTSAMLRSLSGGDKVR
ncbi:hypothetical protein DFH06DRAFT_1439198 [Mycena polygramma]|nr:hypothetical protein DFH06DRAFT_1439198 [Mycena polygramma]